VPGAMCWDKEAPVGILGNVAIVLYTVLAITCARYFAQYQQAFYIAILPAFAIYAFAANWQISRLRNLATQDSLTKLRNRLGAEQALLLEGSRAFRFSHPMSIIYLDCNLFKWVNDQLGHAEGDRVLRQIADLLVSNVRRIDTVCRLGGDEFCVICPETTANTALLVVEKLKAAVQVGLEYKGLSVVVTVSAGAASLDGKNFDPTMQRAEVLGHMLDLLREADTGMQRDKDASRQNRSASPLPART